MADKPIIFSAPMVQALLAGRKTQTRRILKPQPVHCLMWGDPPPGTYPSDKGWSRFPCAPGDRLWCRENWQTHCDMDHITPRDLPHDSAVQYPATYDGWVSRVRPSIHMPRWASRITLIVTDVRVQRLQDISEADAIAEGIKKLPGGNEDQWMDYPEGSSAAGWLQPVNSFDSLWESINGPGSWTENPFVYAVSFIVHKSNIDALKAEAA